MNSNWKKVSLGEVFEVSNHRLGAHDDEPPVFAISKYAGVVLGADYHVQRVASAKLDGYKVVNTGDWAYSTIHIDEGSIARNHHDFSGVVSPMYTILRWDSSEHDPSYFEILLRSPSMLARYGDLAQGSIDRRRSLPWKTFSGINVHVPPLAEQQRIVDLIGSLDDAIEAAESVALAAGRARRATLMNRVRRGWDEVTLGDISNRTIGRTPPRKAAEYWTSDPTQRPFCTIADMKSRKIQGGREGVTELAEAEGKAKRVPAGSLLLSFKLSLGRVGITEEDVFTNEAIAWIRPKEEVDRDFLALALDSLDWSDVGSPAVKGKTLNAESLDALPIPLPPLAEQRLIVDLVGSLDVAVEAAATNLSSLLALRSELLTALLSGAHAIPESYDQPVLKIAA